MKSHPPPCPRYFELQDWQSIAEQLVIALKILSAQTFKLRS